MKIHHIIAPLAAVVLTGCAWSAEGLGRAKIEDVYYSTKAPADVAGCVASRLMGVNPAFQDGENHWVVTRQNGYGVPIVRWDIMPDTEEEGRTRIEFRRSVAMMSGEKKAATCF